MVVEVYWDNEGEGQHVKTLIVFDGVPAAISTVLKSIHKWDHVPTNILGVKVLDRGLNRYQLYPSECVQCLNLTYSCGGVLEPLRRQQRDEDVKRWRDLPSQGSPSQFCGVLCVARKDDGAVTADPRGHGADDTGLA